MVKCGYKILMIGGINMYDSDGSGFFALGIFMVFGTLAVVKFILDNFIWFIAASIIFVIIAHQWIKYGYDIKVKFEKWYISKVRAFLHIFGIELYSKYTWNIFRFIDWLIRCALYFGSLLAGLWILGFILDKI